MAKKIDNSLLKAVIGSNLETIKELLKQGADVNALNNEGDTPLMLAITNDNFEIISFLVDNGANINFQNSQTPLMLAIKKKNFSVIKLLMENGADINVKTLKGNTALIEATNYKPILEIVKYLIDNGADIKAKTVKGNTALHYARECSDLSIIKLLIDNGADVNAQNSYGDTPLIEVLKYLGRDINIVKYFIEKGADVNASNSVGDTALILAIENSIDKLELTDLVKLLVDNKADINAKNIEGITPMISAIGNKYITFEIIKLLFDNGAKLDTKDPDIRNTVMNVLKNADTDIVKSLIDNGINLDLEVSNNDLLKAVDDGNLILVTLLVNNKININLPDEKGWTAFLKAVDNKHPVIAKLLIDYGVDYNKDYKTLNGFNYLMAFCKANLPEKVIELLEQGSDLNESDSTGKTALHYAAEYTGVATIKLLIEKGADIFAKSKIEETVLHFAVENKDVEVAKLFIELGIDMEAKTIKKDDPMADYKQTALNYAAWSSNTEVVELFLKNGAIVNTTTSQGITALWAAARQGDLDTVKVLMKYNADPYFETPRGNAIDIARDRGGNNIAKYIKKEMIKREKSINLIQAENKSNENKLEIDNKTITDVNAKDSNGKTPLMTAVIEQNLDLVHLLLEQGSDVNAKDMNGITALSSSARGVHLEIVQLLLFKGADVNLTDNYLDTALMQFARRSKNKEIVKLLLENGAKYDKDYKNKGNLTYLMAFCEGGFKDLVIDLINKGANINERNVWGTNALIQAISHGYDKEEIFNIVKLLIDNGADINAIKNKGVAADNQTGWTPLMFACNHGYLDIVKLLLEKGADLNIINNDGDSAKDIAITRKRVEIVKYLKSIK